MSANTWVAAAWVFCCASTAFRLYGPLPAPRDWWRRLVAGTSAFTLAPLLLARNWPAAGFCIAVLLMLGRDWWNRKGKRAARALGEKSRARLAAVVEKAREAGTPAPQGAIGLCAPGPSASFAFLPRGGATSAVHRLIVSRV